MRSRLESSGSDAQVCGYALNYDAVPDGTRLSHSAQDNGAQSKFKNRVREADSFALASASKRGANRTHENNLWGMGMTAARRKRDYWELWER